MQVADFVAQYRTNFLSSMLVLSRSVNERWGLGSVFVLSERAKGRPWLPLLADAGIPVHFIDPRASHRRRVALLTRVAADAGAQLVHSHFGTFDVDVGFAAHRLGLASVWHMHSPYPWYPEFRRRLGERLKFLLATRLLVDRIVAVAPSAAETAIAHGAPRAKVTVVLNGIDLDVVRPVDAPARRARRSHLGIREDGILFVLLGTWPERKGVDLLGRAAETLSRTHGGRFRCVVVTGEENVPAVSLMLRGADAVEIVPPVEYIGDLFGLADVFVSASRAEGMPYAVGEAMACGLPVISSDLPQVIAAYGAAGSGFLPFRNGDATSLEQVMARLIEMPEPARRAAGTRNAAFIREHFSLDRWAGEMMGVYQTLLRRSAAPPAP